MPIYYVTVEGRDYTVEIPDPTSRPVQAIVDGRVVEVEVAPADQRAPANPRGQPDWEAPAGRQAPNVQGVGAVSAGETSGRQLTGEALTVAAPLPGTIVSISVSEGDRVERGQELCVLEAMKMNNPIRATQAGVVQEILVSVGQQVQHSHPLLVMGEA
jgi:glutaconyl-CoA/methylmalonyl-CoA decarboxylase subunit gamma